jgi:hypothetical protein
MPEPPEAVAVNTLDCPTSIVQEVGVRETLRAEFTVMEAVLEVAVAGEEALSVTLQ